LQSGGRSLGLVTKTAGRALSMSQNVMRGPTGARQVMPSPTGHTTHREIVGTKSLQKC